MCKCTPEVRTPFCGKPGCAWPAQTSVRPAADIWDGRPERPELSRKHYVELLNPHPTQRGAMLVLWEADGGGHWLDWNRQRIAAPHEVVADWRYIGPWRDPELVETAITKLRAIMNWADLVEARPQLFASGGPAANLRGPIFDEAQAVLAAMDGGLLAPARVEVSGNPGGLACGFDPGPLVEASRVATPNPTPAAAATALTEEGLLEKVAEAIFCARWPGHAWHEKPHDDPPNNEVVRTHACARAAILAWAERDAAQTARLAAQEAEIRRLREVLAPFCEAAEHVESHRAYDSIGPTDASIRITAGNLRRARALLQASEWDGHPQDRDKDGLHLLETRPTGARLAGARLAMAWWARRQQWRFEGEWSSPSDMACHRYLGRVYTAADLAAARREEREACAKLAETDIRSDLAKDLQYKPEWFRHAERIAAAIRAGGGSDEAF